MFIDRKFHAEALLLFLYIYGKSMEIFINRTPKQVAGGTTLAALLSHEGIAADGTAAAIDNKVVPRSAWSTTVLHEGARITVIRAVCGG